MSVQNSFSYEIQYTRAADKFFKVHEDVRTGYENSIRKLLTDDHPESVDLKSVKGKRNTYYRIRIGNYRVVYAIIRGKIVVINTILAGSRGGVYKKMAGLK